MSRSNADLIGRFIRKLCHTGSTSLELSQKQWLTYPPVPYHHDSLLGKLAVAPEFQAVLSGQGLYAEQKSKGTLKRQLQQV